MLSNWTDCEFKGRGYPIPLPFPSVHVQHDCHCLLSERLNPRARSARHPPWPPRNQGAPGGCYSETIDTWDDLGRDHWSHGNDHGSSLLCLGFSVFSFKRQKWGGRGIAWSVRFSFCLTNGFGGLWLIGFGELWLILCALPSQPMEWIISVLFLDFLYPGTFAHGSLQLKFKRKGFLLPLRQTRKRMRGPSLPPALADIPS